MLHVIFCTPCYSQNFGLKKESLNIEQLFFIEFSSNPDPLNNGVMVTHFKYNGHINSANSLFILANYFYRK